MKKRSIYVICEYFLEPHNAVRGVRFILRWLVMIPDPEGGMPRNFHRSV